MEFTSSLVEENKHKKEKKVMNINM